MGWKVGCFCKNYELGKSEKRQEEEISGRASRSVDTDDNESYYRLLYHLADDDKRKTGVSDLLMSYCY